MWWIFFLFGFWLVFLGFFGLVGVFLVFFVKFWSFPHSTSPSTSWHWLQLHGKQCFLLTEYFTYWVKGAYFLIYGILKFSSKLLIKKIRANKAEESSRAGRKFPKTLWKKSTPCQVTTNILHSHMFLFPSPWSGTAGKPRIIILQAILLFLSLKSI